MRYPYRCPDHGEFEITRSMHEDIPADAECPECGAASGRVYEASTIVYKGSGFHTTDYFDSPKGRGQPMDRKEWLNSNWSKATGEAPPKPSGKIE